MRTPEWIANAKAEYSENLMRTELSSLPEGYVAGGSLTVTLGDVLVNPLVANIEGKRVTSPNILNIADMKWITVRQVSTTYYIYLDKYGFWFVDALKYIAVEGRYGKYNPRDFTRFIGEVYVNSSGFYVTTDIVGIQIIGYSGVGSNEEPKEGDRRIYIDDDEISFEEYTGGAWSTVNSIKIGGVDSNSLFYPFLQCRGLVNPLADEISQEFFPSNDFSNLTFETNYDDQNGVSPTSTITPDRSTVWAKFGTYSFFATATNLGTLNYDDFIVLGSSMSIAGWYNITTVEAQIPFMAAEYRVDASNVYLISLIYFQSGGYFIARLIEEVDGSSIQDITINYVYDENLLVASPHHIGLILSFTDNKLYFVLDDKVEEAAVSAITVTGSSATNQFRIYSANAYKPAADTITVYADDVIFSLNDEATPDLFIQHFNHNVPWNTDISAEDILIKPATGGAAIIDGDLEVNGSMPNAVPIGSVMPWTTTVAPAGYLLCDGTSHLRATYSDLFDIIGTTYGSDDGTHFNVPDFRGMFLRGSGAHGTLNMANGNDVDGGSVADENVDQMFAHWHEFEFRGNTTPGNDTSYINHGPSIGPPATQSTSNDGVKGAYTDGVSGTPNDGPETYPSHGVINWIIRATNTSVTLEDVTSATIADLIVTNSADIRSNLDVGGNLEVTGSISTPKAMMTPEGGLAISLTNETGSATVAGQLIQTDTTTNDAFATSGANSDDTIGIVLEAGVADGSEAWVVISGIADVLMDAGGSARGDRIISSATAGSADVWNTGGAVATHFLEIGHCIETRTGAGLARCVVHFN